MAHSGEHREHRAIRELLLDYKEVGARVVLFLESFHVEGSVGKIGREFVTLVAGGGEGVEVESNDSGNTLEKPHKIHVKLSDIQAVSDDTEIA